MRWFKRQGGERMPARFEKLAVYNGERARGIAHTPEKDAEMAELQADFNRWLREPHTWYKGMA